jgi:hypothetical protein
MSLLASILGGSVIQGAKGIAEIVDKFVETPEEKKAAEIVLMKLMQKPDEVQAEINKIEAGHRSLFVAGWRPSLGWICAAALGWGWILAPVLLFIFPDKTMPAIELGQATSLVMAMLGMGALRSYEKKNHITK